MTHYNEYTQTRDVQPAARGSHAARSRFLFGPHFNLKEH